MHRERRILQSVPTFHNFARTEKGIVNSRLPRWGNGRREETVAQGGLRQFLGHWDHVEVCWYKSVNIRGQPFGQRQPQTLSSTSVVLLCVS